MKRRKFITIAGISGVAMAAIGTLKFFTTPFEGAAFRLIIAELGFLKLDHSGVKKFVTAYAENKDRRYKWAVKGYQLLGIRSANSGKVHQLVSTYLLSTDFFRNEMDESRVIRYVGLYDPYQRPCANPFFTPIPQIDGLAARKKNDQPAQF